MGAQRPRSLLTNGRLVSAASARLDALRLAFHGPASLRPREDLELAQHGRETLQGELGLSDSEFEALCEQQSAGERPSWM